MFSRRGSGRGPSILIREFGGRRVHPRLVGKRASPGCVAARARLASEGRAAGPAGGSAVCADGTSGVAFGLGAPPLFCWLFLVFLVPGIRRGTFCLSGKALRGAVCQVSGGSTRVFVGLFVCFVRRTADSGWVDVGWAGFFHPDCSPPPGQPGGDKLFRVGGVAKSCRGPIIPFGPVLVRFPLWDVLGSAPARARRGRG